MTYKVHHVIPSTGEWGCVHVDTLCQAYCWYRCKLTVKRVNKTIVTLFGPNDLVVVRVEK